MNNLFRIINAAAESYAPLLLIFGYTGLELSVR